MVEQAGNKYNSIKKIEKYSGNNIIQPAFVLTYWGKVQKDGCI